MKLELSKDETANVFSVYGSALKDAAEGRAQTQRLQEKLSESDRAKTQAQREKQDVQYNLDRMKEDKEYHLGNATRLQTAYNTLQADMRKVQSDLAIAQKALANVPPATVWDVNVHNIKTLTPILDAIAHGNKIDAIRQVREATQLGLKEAKDMVEGTALKAPTKASSGCG